MSLERLLPVNTFDQFQRDRDRETEEESQTEFITTSVSALHHRLLKSRCTQNYKSGLMLVADQMDGEIQSNKTIPGTPITNLAWLVTFTY